MYAANVIGKRYYLYLVALFFCCRVLASGKTDDASKHSIEASIQALINLSEADHSIPEKHITQGMKTYFNPDARSELMRQMKTHPQRELLIKNYGYVAESRDVIIYNDILYNTNSTTDSAPIMAISALAIMSRRGVNGADELLDKVLSPDFWKDKKTHYGKTHYLFRGGKGSECAMFIYVASQKAHTSDPRRYEKIAAALDEIKDNEIRDKIASETEVANYVYGIPRYRALAENYATKIQPSMDAQVAESVRREREYREKRAQRGDARSQEGKYEEYKIKIHKILDNRNNCVVDQLSVEARTNIIQEADQFLDTKIKPWIEKANDDKARNDLLISTADDAVPFFGPLNMKDSENMDKWLARRPNMSNALVELHDVVKVLIPKERDLEHARIMSYSFDKIDRSKAEEIRKDPKSKADMIMVIIPVKNGEDLKTKFPKYFKKSGPFGPLITLDENGTPLIHVVYHHDMNKWFWNPPGW